MVKIFEILMKSRLNMISPLCDLNSRDRVL
jgi:hypothetical protein